MPAGRVVDAWMQHPTPAFCEAPAFESLRRWSRGAFPPAVDQPIEATIAAMDEAGVAVSMCCAWWGPIGL